jgi:hypothetical protein
VAQLILLLAPLVLVQLALMAFALNDLIHRPRVRGGNKLPWALLIVLVNTIGPVIYLLVGREE